MEPIDRRLFLSSVAGGFAAASAFDRALAQVEAAPDRPSEVTKAALLPFKRRRTLHHHFIYGQSNATLAGVHGSYVGEISKAVAAHNQALMFNGGMFPNFTQTATWPGSSVEQAAAIPPQNMAFLTDAYYGGARVDMEAPGLGFAERYSADHPDNELLISGHSVAGFGIAQLKKGTQPYANIVSAAMAAKVDARRLGLA